MKRQSLLFGIILLFLISNLSSAVIGFDTEKVVMFTIYDNGSLSGYVNDSYGTSIEAAVVRITCGDYIFKNYSDSSGYYYIDNVPIVDCYWNVSASKNGYKTSSLDMSIDENTTHDFTLKSIDNIIYVDNDGDSDYTKIQDAIDNASNGDTIFVFNGTYFENITINKSIKLIGEDFEKTKIDGKNAEIDSINIIFIEADDVIVDTFLLINSNDSDFNSRFDSGISISNSHNVTINNTFIIGCRRGISLIYSSATIKNNKILRTKNFGDTGIGVWYSDANVSYNIINGNYSSCIYSGLSNTTILNNIVGESDTYGIHVSDSLYADGSQIIGNLIQRNNYGIFMDYCYKVKVENNTFLNNRLNALFSNCILTRWNGNYWGRPRILPKPIIGFIWIYPSLPILNFDWHPSKEPNIPITQSGY